MSTNTTNDEAKKKFRSTFKLHPDTADLLESVREDLDLTNGELMRLITRGLGSKKTKDLLGQAKKLGFDIEEIITESVAVHCEKVIWEATKIDSRRGSADDRILETYEEFLANGIYPTPYALRMKAKTGDATIKRWLKDTITPEREAKDRNRAATNRAAIEKKNREKREAEEEEDSSQRAGLRV